MPQRGSEKVCRRSTGRRSVYEGENKFLGHKQKDKLKKESQYLQIEFQI